MLAIWQGFLWSFLSALEYSYFTSSPLLQTYISSIPYLQVYAFLLFHVKKVTIITGMTIFFNTVSMNSFALFTSGPVPSYTGHSRWFILLVREETFDTVRIFLVSSNCFCRVKETSTRLKRQPAEWKKNLCQHVPVGVNTILRLY